MTDINGIVIKVGMTVESMQPSGGMLPPGKPSIGIVEECMDAFGEPSMQIRTADGRLILLTSKINKVL